MSIRPVGELVLPASSASARPEATHPAPVARAGPTHERASFAGLLHALGEESDRGESLVKRAVAGRSMDPGQLLALQAGIYRYGEVVDLATKLVDRASTGAKTVLQGQ